MTYHLIIHYTNSETKETKFLAQYTNEKYEILSYKHNVINASFDRFDAEREITKKLFPEFYKDNKNTNQRHPQIKFLEFTKINELSDDKNDIYDVKAILPMVISEPYQWVKSTKLENEIFNKYERYIENIVTIPEPKDYKVVNFVNKLVDASRVNKLALFIGAGFSKNYGYPLWAELINDIKSKYGISDTNDPLKFAQLFYNTVGHHEYYTYLKKVFTKLPTDPKHDLLKEVFKISPNSIITTNYDELLENSIHNLDYQAISSNDDLAYSQSSRLILKMHGDFKKNNIVFKEDDYLSYSKSHQLIEYYVQSLIASKTLLIIGFSYDDINLKYIVQRIKDIHQQDFNRISIFFADAEVPEIEIKYFESKGLDVLKYTGDIIYYLEGQSKLNCKTHEERLYSFLSLLNQSINNEIGIEIQNPVEQAYTLFEKYKHIPTISPYLIGNIQPYRNMNEKYPNTIYMAETGTISTTENVFWRRLNQISFDYDNIYNSEDYLNNKISKNEAKWWKKILETNRMSCLWYYSLLDSTSYKEFWIEGNGPKTDLETLRDSGKIKILLEKCEDYLNCADLNQETVCQYNKAVYYLVFLGRFGYAMKICQALIFYYINNKDFYNALRIISISSDMKYLVKNGMSNDLSDDSREDLFEFINEYNEREKLFEFPLSKFERENYIEIYFEEREQKIFNSTNKAYLTYESVYIGYKKEGYMMSGTNFVYDISLSFLFYYNQFYHNSNPKLFYSNKKNFLNIFIFSNLLSVNINEDYEYCNKDGLSEFFISVYLNYFSPKDLKAFHDKYPEIRVILSKEAEVSFNSFTENFLDSLIYKNLFGIYEIDKFMSSEIQKSFYLAQELNYTLAKIVWLLSYWKNKDKRNKIIKSNFEKIKLIIKNGIIYEFDFLIEFAFTLIEIDICYYAEFLAILIFNELALGKRREIFITYAKIVLKKCNDSELSEKFKFIFEEFKELNEKQQTYFIRLLIENNKPISIQKINVDYQLNHMKNGLLKGYFIYMQKGNIENVKEHLINEINDSEIKTYTNESIFYINDENTARSLYIIMSDDKLKMELRNENLGSYYRFTLFPNEVDYKEINPKWLLTGHSNYNIDNLSKETIIIWLQKLVELKAAFPNILIDHMFKKLGQALGKLNN